MTMNLDFPPIFVVFLLFSLMQQLSSIKVILVTTDSWSPLVDLPGWALWKQFSLTSVLGCLLLSLPVKPLEKLNLVLRTIEPFYLLLTSCMYLYLDSIGTALKFSPVQLWKSLIHLQEYIPPTEILPVRTHLSIWSSCSCLSIHPAAQSPHPLKIIPGIRKRKWTTTRLLESLAR